MAVTVVGKRIGTFKDKEDGTAIQFGKIYVVYDDSEMKGLEGQVAEAISVKPELCKEIEVGAEIKLIYNKYGKVSDFTA